MIWLHILAVSFCIACWLRVGWMLLTKELFLGYPLRMEEHLTRWLFYGILTCLAPIWWPVTWVFGPRDEL